MAPISQHAPKGDITTRPAGMPVGSDRGYNPLPMGHSLQFQSFNTSLKPRIQLQRPPVLRYSAEVPVPRAHISSSYNLAVTSHLLRFPTESIANQKPRRKNWKFPKLTTFEQDAECSFPPEVPQLGDDLHILLGPKLYNLKRLDLSGKATDPLLVQISASGLPQLEELLCARSPRLSDQGMLSLTASSADERRPWDTKAAVKFLDGKMQSAGKEPPCPRLREVDVTFCNGTTYAMTLALRRLLPDLKIVRRVPLWMTGENITPFLDGKDRETHTYFADGSFSFKRSGESKGFVHQLQEGGESGVVREALQYIDYSSEGEWPTFAEFCYRPGVAVLRSDGLSADSGGHSPSIYVWETCDGMRAPSRFTPIAAERIGLAPKQMAIVRRDGSHVAGADPDDDHPRCLVLSHMAVRPHPVDKQMPPEHLTTAIARYIVRHQDPTLDEAAAERLIHKETGGHPDDDATWVSYGRN